MRNLRVPVVFALALGLVASACGGGPGTAPTTSPGATGAAVSSDPFVMLSTQLNTVTESEALRTQILSGFTAAKVEFRGEAAGPFADRIVAESKIKGTVGVVGGLHGDFGALDLNLFEDLTPLATKLKDRGFPAEFMELGKLGTTKQIYIPWMQATYILGVNKQALQYLPSGVSVDNITYQQLTQWCKNISDQTGRKRCGLPAGPMSLLHRLIQGYMYPAYTGGLVTTYKSPEAAQLWQDLKNLWQYTNPQSLQIDFMQESLLSGEVWVGFDHVARLVKAFEGKPNDFVAAPAPKGPKGLYYMSVLAGLGIPKSTPNKSGAEAFIDYMTTPAVQSKTLTAVAFFPVIGQTLPADLPAFLKIEADGVAKQAAHPDAKVALLPIGLGAKGGEFNKVQLDTFQRIVIKGEDIQKVLTEQAAILQAVMNDTKAPCWKPDPPSTGPCQVK
jgi:multiple sugar transport system substrate-binding protein